ncbi:MAG: hypothetical protein ABI640_12850 [Gammaproteobacteria bacterium]
MIDNHEHGNGRRPFKLDGRQKVTISLATALAFIVGLWQFHEWTGRHLKDHLVSTQIGSELAMQIHEAVDAAKQSAKASETIGRSLSLHIAGQDLKEAHIKLDTAKTDLATTQLWESVNGANEISRARKRELEFQIERTTGYIACREASRESCVL